MLPDSTEGEGLISILEPASAVWNNGIVVDRREMMSDVQAKEPIPSMRFAYVI